MNKSTFFTGQPIFSQLVSLISKSAVRKAVVEHKSDRYYKRFDTFHHLITMLYASYQHCTSLREVVTGMQACEGRLQPLGIRYLPARSTLSEANESRSYQVFEKIYQSILTTYRSLLPDSQSRFPNLVLVDSTTISLFKEIMKNAGNKGADGKRKGGIKVHMAVRSNENVPYLIRFTAGANADVPFLKHINLPAGSVVVMDRGYSSFSKYNEWTVNKVNWVTRISPHNIYTIDHDRPLAPIHQAEGVVSDQDIMLGFAKKKERVRCRLVRFFDAERKRTFLFITNNFDWSPVQVASIYKQRWQIELLFKRIKQNMPLQYFLGDNENAIKIQIYCSLIADILLKLATLRLKRKWAFSNLAAFVRLHLMNYTNLTKFLENPDKCRICNPTPHDNTQLKLNFSG
ncbi:MAG: IS4 family transposase [Flavipsychrobacter sp.]|nr:IS4 family transposase [Flavipsychrobacter sp.]